MHRIHLTYKNASEPLRHQFSKSGNSLGIGNTNFIWDHKRSQLILIMETSKMVSRDIRALLKGNSLILEAPLISSYNKPFRTHLIGQDIRDEFEDGFMVIGFSEVKLKYGYKYHFISCQAIDSKMIKVILGFTLWGRNGNN